MIEISDSRDVRVIKWAENQAKFVLGLNAYYNADECHAIVISEGANVLGVIVIHNYNPPATLEASFFTLSPKWASRKVIKHFFNYCFNVAKIKRIYTQVCADNTKALKMNSQLGFTQMALLPDFVVTTDGKIKDSYIFSMTKDECKWLWAEKAAKLA